MDLEEKEDNQVVVSIPRRGRPPKAVVEAKRKRGKVGRPQGDTGRIAEFKNIISNLENQAKEASEKTNA